MAKITTASGFTCDFDRAALDDMRTFELLSVVTDDSAEEFTRLRATAAALESLLGHEQKEALYNHIAAANGGRVPFIPLFTEISEIMNASAGKDTAKN